MLLEGLKDAEKQIEWVEAVLSLGTIKHRFRNLVVGELFGIEETSDNLKTFSTDLFLVL